MDTKFQAINIRPVKLASVKPDPKKPNPRIGISEMKFSDSGRYLASRNDASSSAIFIWDVQKLKLKSLVVLKNPYAIFFEWEPHSPRLVIAGNNCSNYVWTPLGVVAC